MKKGDIVLIPFPFADLSGNKNRPAIVLIGSENDVTVCFITTQFKWQSDYDISLEPTDLNGLKKTSLIRVNKFATIDKSMVLGRLGNISIEDLTLLNKNLIKVLKLEQ